LYSILSEAWRAMSKTLGHNSREYLLRQLRRQLGRRPGSGSNWFVPGAASTDDGVVFSAGTPAIDHLLPGGGLRHGMLVEWLSALPGSGAATLSLLAAREACRAGGMLVVIDRRQTFYPPAAVAWGVDPQRLIVVHPRSLRDELWAAVQSLRSPATAAMWAAIDRLDDRAFRRLQLAAQAGRTLGLVLRPARARDQPSWADVRLWVGKFRISDFGLRITSANPQSAIRNPQCFAHSRYVHVQVLRCHGGRPGNSTTLEIDDAAYAVREVNRGVPLRTGPAVPKSNDTHPLPLAAELADPAARSISARA
jgi:hypothetical protein